MAGVLDQLAPDELATVTQEAKSEQDLPSYYSASQQTDVQISRDFEAFLILSTSEMKTSALTWINQAVSLNKPNKLRDALAALTVTQELKNSKLQLDAYTQTLGDFETFRQNFSTGSVFSAVPEVQLFINDLQSMIDELVVGQQRAFFDNTIATVIQGTLKNQAVTQAQLEELQSWTTVISAYLGG